MILIILMIVTYVYRYEYICTSIHLGGTARLRLLPRTFRTASFVSYVHEATTSFVGSSVSFVVSYYLVCLRYNIIY